MATSEIRVVAISNAGEELTQVSKDWTDAEKRAKALRTPMNHMVCIEEAGDRVLRWDRDHAKGSNRWRRVDVDDFETLGAIREVEAAQ